MKVAVKREASEPGSGWPASHRIQLSDAERKRVETAHGLQECRAYLLYIRPADSTARRLARVLEAAIDQVYPPIRDDDEPH